MSYLAPNLEWTGFASTSDNESERGHSWCGWSPSITINTLSLTGFRWSLEAWLSPQERVRVRNRKTASHEHGHKHKSCTVCMFSLHFHLLIIIITTDQKTNLHLSLTLTYPINSRRRLLRLTPVVDFARISTKICGNLSTMHTNSVLKLATCSNVSDCIVPQTVSTKRRL